MGWPKGVPMQRQLSDADLAVIAAADTATTTVILAAALGKPYFTVAHARQKMHRLGSWCCPVAIGVCTECGGLLLTSPERPRMAHPACRHARAARYSRVRRREGRAAKSTPYVAAWREREPARSRELREQEKARLRARWPELPAEVQAAALAKLHAADARDYPLTVHRARQSGRPWSAEEDGYILEAREDPGAGGGARPGPHALGSKASTDAPPRAARSSGANSARSDPGRSPWGLSPRVARAGESGPPPRATIRASCLLRVPT